MFLLMFTLRSDGPANKIKNGNVMFTFIYAIHTVATHIKFKGINLHVLNVQANLSVFLFEV